jgi:cysteine-rich repeat protein
MMLVLAFTIPCASACQILGDLACGDGKVDVYGNNSLGLVDEECDDGNEILGDGCNSACEVEYGWVCDDQDPTSCTPNCGDGHIVETEECDDGNDISGDGCDSACEVEDGWKCYGELSTCIPNCGDGIVDLGEDCDDGNNVAGDGCSANCTLESCGDGIVDPGEQCDDGNEIDDDDCSNDCTLTNCGNAQVDPGEQCDDGNSDDCDGCNTVCTISSCGDGILCGLEVCDDGDLNSDTVPDACRTNCNLPRCGDGVVDTGEECEGGIFCRYDCTLERCGDGILDPGEECDDGNTVNEDCCRSDCTFTPGGPIGINYAYTTPALSSVGGVRPRYTMDTVVEAVVTTTETMGTMEVEIVGCDPAKVSDCSILSEPAAPNSTIWSIRLPSFAPGSYALDITVTSVPGCMVQASYVAFDVYPPDPGLSIECEKSYDGGGGLTLAFTIVDTGLPIDPNTGQPYTLADMYDVRYYLLQDKEGLGFAQDETDPFLSSFILIQPQDMLAADDGEYQLFFTGLLGFIEPIQAELHLDTTGGPNDVCTLAP